MLDSENNNIINEYYTRVNEALPPMPGGLGSGGPAPMPGMGAPAPGSAAVPGGAPGGANLPLDATDKPAEKPPLTPEGQITLYDMIRQALAFTDHEAMSPDEKGLFDIKVTQENFDQMKSKIESIFTSHINTGPAPAASNSMEELA